MTGEVAPARHPTGTSSGIIWIANDYHGTGQVAIDGATLTVTRRKTDPFGNPRGTDPTWPNPHGFVNGTRDNTGLTHLGAREYEPATGRFVSDDSIVDLTDPQQSNGYSYANGNPTTSSDPTGPWNDHDPKDTPAPERPCTICNTVRHTSAKTAKTIHKVFKPRVCKVCNATRRAKPAVIRSIRSVVPRGKGLVGTAGLGQAPLEGSASLTTCPADCVPFSGYSIESVGPYSVAWCAIAGTADCIEGMQTAFEILDLAKTVKDQRGWSAGQMNAFRHGLWMMLLTGYFGFSVDEAMGLGAAHELDGNHEGATAGTYDSNVDMHNNHAGAQLGADMRATMGTQWARETGTPSTRPSHGWWK